MFQNRFYELRVEHGFTKEQIAEMLCCSPQDYDAYERGIEEISIPEAIRLCDIYQVSLDYLSDLTDERERYPACEDKSFVSQGMLSSDRGPRGLSVNSAYPISPPMANWNNKMVERKNSSSLDRTPKSSYY